MKRVLFRLTAFMLLFALWTSSFSAPKPPFRFIENRNQWNSKIQYAGVIPGGNIILERGKIRYLFRGSFPSSSHHANNISDDPQETYMTTNHIVDLNFIGANNEVVLLPFQQSSEYYNFFIGKDPASWAGNVRGYQGIIYSSLYDGVDLKIYTGEGSLKYDLIVAPGANADQITFAYEGHGDLYIDNGSLHVVTALGEIIERKPFTYQVIGGKRIEIPSAFKLDGDQLKFLFPQGYDQCYPLIIDPLLIFSTFSGSEADNWGSSATPGEHGTLYSTGVTNHFVAGTFSGTYPATPGAFQTTYGGIYDIGLLKYDSTGAQLLYASYLGGLASECPHSMVVNNNKELLVLGTTGSADFPVTAGAYDRTFNFGSATDLLTTQGIEYPEGSDIIVCKISTDGTTLLSSTFFGGSLNDGINHLDEPLNRNYGDDCRGDIIVDESDNIYISSVTRSSDFPVKDGLGHSYHGGGSDALVAKFSNDLSDLEWASFLGGSGTDASHSIQFDPLGDIILGGGTTSSDFDMIEGAYQDEFSGGVDGWVAKLSGDGSTLLASSFAGTSEYDQIYFIDLNSEGDIFAYGQTSGNFPVTAGTASNPGSGQFIQRFNNQLDSLRFSTVFGSGNGIPDISPTAFAVNDCNKLFIAGWGGQLNAGFNRWPGSSTDGMFVTNDALKQITSGNDLYFLVMSADGSAFLYATFFGGQLGLTHVDGGTSRFEKKGIVYHAVCGGCGGLESDFPTTPDAWSRTNNSNNCNNAAFKLDLSTLKAEVRSNNTILTRPGLTTFCIPDTVYFENLSIGGALYEWTFGDGATISTRSLEPVKHYFDEPGTYNVKLKAIDPGNCQAIDSSLVTIQIFEGSFTVSPDDNVCEGSQYQLHASGGISYDWFTSDGAFTSHVASPLVLPKDTTRYYVSMMNANGCIKDDSVLISVIPKIVPDFEFNRGDACFSDPQIEVIDLTDSLTGTDFTFFDFGDGHQDEGDRVSHVYDEPGNYPLKLVAVRDECVFEKTVNEPFGAVFVPNVITPSATLNKNDAFMILYGAENGERTQTTTEAGFKTSVVIYNRWGRKVFESHEYQHDWHAEDADAGTYYFEVVVEDHPGCKGWLQVIK